MLARLHFGEHMKKVIILAINSKYIHSCLAAWVLSAAVKKFCSHTHNVKVIEANINQTIDEICRGDHWSPAPDIVAIPTYIWNAKKLPYILEEIRKKLPNTKIVLGGPEAEHNANFWLQNGADAVLNGEGEKTLPAYLVGDAASRVPHPDCDTQIDPFTDEYLTALTGKIAYIETSRGCPFSCAYCLSGDDPVRFFDIETAKGQLAKLSKANVRVIKFVDRTFNCNAARAYELIEYIMGLNSDKCFHFEVAADLFDDATLSLLATAPSGLFQIEAGIQSFFAPALSASTRKTNLEKVAKNIRRLLAAGNIHIHLDLIAGLPNETLTEFENSFNSAFDLAPHKLQLGFLKMLHGSALRKNHPEIIFDAHPPYQIIKSPWMSEADLNTLYLTEDALQNTQNKSHFLRTIGYAMGAGGLSPFAFFRRMGESFQKKGMALEAYAEKIFNFCKALDGVAKDALMEHMIIDWMEMVKGVNMPPFLKIATKQQHTHAINQAETALNRKIRRNEAAILPSGQHIFVDAQTRHPITKLYKTTLS